MKQEFGIHHVHVTCDLTLIHAIQSQHHSSRGMGEMTKSLTFLSLPEFQQFWHLTKKSFHVFGILLFSTTEITV
jgi:hypothetical protein